MSRVEVVCCVCKAHLQWIEWCSAMPTDDVSHGLCADCYKLELQKVDDAFRRDEALRQKEE